MVKTPDTSFRRAEFRFFLPTGGALKHTVRGFISILGSKGGMKVTSTRRESDGARVHDLRHAFVASRMLTWYREGINPQSRLPFLATYLGHKDIHSTLVYLTVTQDLLQQASERFRVRGAQLLRTLAEGGNA